MADQKLILTPAIVLIAILVARLPSYAAACDIDVRTHKTRMLGVNVGDTIRFFGQSGAHVVNNGDYYNLIRQKRFNATWNTQIPVEELMLHFKRQAISVSESGAPLTVLRSKVPASGTVFKDCDQCPEMVVVPAGSFMMGAPESEPGRLPPEFPQHMVVIASPFAIGKYEVTFEEWDACMADGGCTGRRPDDRGWGRGRRPVINVSWHDAKTYTAWLSRKTGKSYRLLSEAEWEYAARAGTTTPFHFGATIRPNQANYDGNHVYEIGPVGAHRQQIVPVKSAYRQQTVPVGSFPANAFGLHDMHGNVWEWVEDCWSGNYSGAPSDGSARLSGKCDLRVLRGGSWDNVPWLLRSAYRYWGVTTNRLYSFGFRVARNF